MTTIQEEGQDKKETKTVLLLLAAGLLARALYAWAATAVPPWNDLAIYDQGRLEILNLGSYSLDYPPVYSFFLAVVSFIFGGGHLTLYLAQAVVSTATCYLLYLIARKTFGKSAGLLTLVVSCLYIDMVWYTGVLMAETFGIFLLTLVVYLVLTKKHPAITGIAFGLTCLTKGVYLISLPALLLWLFLNTERKSAARAVITFTACMFLAIAPWTIRNYGVHKGFVLITAHEGGSIFMGHNPYAKGGADFDFLPTDYGSFERDPSLTTKQKTVIARNLAFDFIRNNPGREVELFFLKLSKYWSLRTHFDMNNGPYPLRKTFFFLSILTHMVLFPAMILGAFFSRKDKTALVSHFVIGLNTLIFITIFFATGRMRFQLVPFILLLSGYGLSLLPGIIAGLKGPDAAALRKRLTAPAVITVLLYINFIYQILEKHAVIAARF